MSRLDSRYRIGRHTATCAATGAALEPGTATVTVLVDLPPDESAAPRGGSAADGGLERRDYAADAWEAIAEADRPAGLIAQWRTVAPDPDAPRQSFVDDETLLELFRNLGEDPRPARRAFRFVLGLLLMRKKLLKLEGRRTRAALPEEQGEDGRPAEVDLWLLRPKGEDPEAPPLELVDPGLAESDVEGLSEQIAEVLDEQG